MAYVSALDTLDGTSGYARTMRSRGVLGRAYVIDGRLIFSEMTAPATGWDQVMRTSKKVQRQMVVQLQKVGMEEDELGVAMAVLTGDRHLLAGDLRDDYSRSGISHILAISGLHLGIIFLLLNFLFAPFLFWRYGRVTRTAIVILLLWAYAFVSGMSASVLRAAFMLSVMQLSMMTVWSYNSYNALFASAFVLILLRPTFIYDLSFQMSYLALFSILFFFPRFSRWFGISKLERWIYLQKQRSSGVFYLFWLITAQVVAFMSGAILIGLAAQIAVAPLVGFIFGRIPFVSLLINPFVMLMITWIMVVGFIYIVVGSIPWLAWVGDVLNFMLRVQNGVVEWTASLRWASLENVSFSGNVLSLIYFMLLLVMVWIKYLEERRSETIAKDGLYYG